MHNDKFSLAASVLAIAAFLLISCAPVRLIESHDPRIEEGISEYQRSLDSFVQRTLLNYEKCQLNREELERLSRMNCNSATDDVRAICEATLDNDRQRVGAAVDISCAAASYAGNRESFYIPQSAHLHVMRTRASVLDSIGVCAVAANGLAKLVDSAIPAEVRDAVNDVQQGDAANCTEVIVREVLNNHMLLEDSHRRIDEIDAETASGPMQAELALPPMRDTLVQNVRIVLFLEEAKKRGDTGQ